MFIKTCSVLNGINRAGFPINEKSTNIDRTLNEQEEVITEILSKIPHDMDTIDYIQIDAATYTENDNFKMMMKIQPLKKEKKKLFLFFVMMS